LRATKTFRYTRALRRLYSSARGRLTPSRS
jgi:hypothetical protein